MCEPFPEWGTRSGEMPFRVCASASSAKLFYDDGDVSVACVGNFQVTDN